MKFLKFRLIFSFDSKKKLFLEVKIFFNQDEISPALSQLMQFLYQHENALPPDDVDLAYSLSKVLKKVDIDGRVTYAIREDEDMAFFFQKMMDKNSYVEYKQQGKFLPLKFESPLPLTISVRKQGRNITCTLLERQLVRAAPLSFLILNSGTALLCFCEGYVHSITQDFANWINKLLEKEHLVFHQDQIAYLAQQFYRPYRHLVNWYEAVSLDDWIPKERTPTAYLRLNYENKILTPQLLFQYNKQLIDSSTEEIQIQDIDTGVHFLRQPDMEQIYQDDLIALFQEKDLPFLLQEPADMSRFLTEIIPLLTERGWIIESQLPEFLVHSEPITLTFTMHAGSSQDWFEFEPNCDVLGQKMSLQELAALMIKEKGYIKLKKGYARLSEDSKKQLSMLSKLGAFQQNKQFHTREILPFLWSSNTVGGNLDAEKMIFQIKNLQDFASLTLPSSFKGELRDYQWIGVKWMSFLYHNRLGGILADDMGLGKTVQTIAFVSTLENRQNPVLVLGPTNVIYNWQKEIEKFLPSSKVLVYAGHQREGLRSKIASSDFVITSFGILKNDLAIFQEKQFSILLIDEAQAIKNAETQNAKAVKQLQADFKLVMTGTPIENSLSDLWNLFDTIMPNFLGTSRDFDASILQLDSLKEKIKPFVLRREKKEVLTSLPEKTEIILDCPLSDAQMSLYQTVLDAAKRGIQQSSGGKQKLNILAALLKLRQVCTHPQLLKELNKHDDIPSAKFELVKEKILELTSENHKLVVFSQFTGMLDILQTWLQSEKILLERIDGQVTGKARSEAVDRFQQYQGSMVFLISLKAGGVGITLTEADYVLHLDPWWNPAIENQATDRVHRMGQKNKVFVYKFIAKGTVEEKIQLLQKEKKELLGRLIDLDHDLDEKLDIDQLKEIFL